MHGNCVEASEPREFYVWIDPSNDIAMHNARLVGQFNSSNVSQSAQLLPLLPNPDFKNVPIAPFSFGVIRPYLAEYHLEIARSDRFPTYPSRLSAIFLLSSRHEAEKYREHNPSHVGTRQLMRVLTLGSYLLSEHDSSWIEFLRLGHSMDSDTIDRVADAYWSGIKAEDVKLASKGKPWTRPSIREILFEGAVKFID